MATNSEKRIVFVARFGELAGRAGIALLPARFPVIFAEDDVIANWIDSEHMRSMRVQEAAPDETLRLDAFFSRQGVDDRLMDLYFGAIDTPSRVQVIFDAYVKWFIECQEPSALESWIEQRVAEANA